MSPSPKEIEPQNFREPFSLLLQGVKEGQYPWLLGRLKRLGGLKRRGISGFLVDSSGGFCVHLITNWSKGRNWYREVHQGKDFKERVELLLPKQSLKNETIEVDWGGTVGKKIYDGYRPFNGFFVIGAASDVDEIPSLSFKKLEEGLLRAAGRL